MAKKKKPNYSIQASNEFSTIDSNEDSLKSNEETTNPKQVDIIKKSEEVVEDSELDELLGEKSKDDIVDKANSSKFLSRLTPEMVEKLEKIDALEKHCLELEEQNSKLSESINSYLEEIEILKSKKAAEVQIDGEMSLVDLKKELDQARKEIAEMRKSLKELREENDSYLIKISELTFENAKLTCQLQEIEKSMVMSASPTHNTSARVAAVKPNTGTMKNQPKFANPYLQNGYQDW